MNKICYNEKGDYMKKFYIVSVLTIIIDRILKILASTFLTTKKLYIIKDFFYLVSTYNEGAAFSSFEGMTILFIFIAICSLIYIFYYMKKYDVKSVGLALLAGGIIGNLIDRIIYRYVIDFIGFEIGNYSLPIFNIAYIAIAMGAIVIMIGCEKNEVNSR